MIKVALIITLVTLTPVVCFAQGILDSVLGPGGLGVWGGGGSNQFNYQQFQGQEAAGQQGYQQGQNPYAQQAPGYGAPPGYGAQPPPAYPNYSQGVYSDWQNYQQPPSAPQGPPPISYTAPPPQQVPPQYGPPTAEYGQQQLRPGQYSPNQAPPLFDDNLPSGAVRITTQTPDGTTVQYYGPQGDEGDQQVAARQPRARRGQPSTQAAKPKRQAQDQAASSGTPQAPGTSIAMPRPVEIPQGQDPRSGWNSSFNRMAPVAPPAQ